jgi:hypothetical protein
MRQLGMDVSEVSWELFEECFLEATFLNNSLK